jgi:hypothetical protein
MADWHAYGALLGACNASRSPNLMDACGGGGGGGGGGPPPPPNAPQIILGKPGAPAQRSPNVMDACRGPGPGPSLDR